MKQKFQYHGFHPRLVSREWIPSLKALKLVEKNLLRFKISNRDPQGHAKHPRWPMSVVQYQTPTGLGINPLMNLRWCLASHWSVPVLWTPLYLENHWRVTKSVHRYIFQTLITFWSTICRSLKAGTYEEEIVSTLLTNFQQTVQNMFHTLLGVFCCVCLFVAYWLDGKADRHIATSCQVRS